MSMTCFKQGPNNWEPYPEDGAGATRFNRFHASFELEIVNNNFKIIILILSMIIFRIKFAFILILVRAG